MKPQGVIGLEGGELHHNGTHWRSLLIQRKVRVSNGVFPLYKGCAASLVGSTLVGSWLPADFNRPKPIDTIRRNRIGLVVPSIAHAIISLFSMEVWQS